MNTTKFKHEFLAHQWAQRIVDFKNSGLPLKEWLSINNLSRDQYFYWKRKLSDEVLDTVTTTTFVELPQVVPTSAPTAVETSPLLESPIKGTTPPPDAILNVNGFEIKLFNSVTADLLKNVIEVARHA